MSKLPEFPIGIAPIKHDGRHWGYRACSGKLKRYFGFASYGDNALAEAIAWRQSEKKNLQYGAGRGVSLIPYVVIVRRKGQPYAWMYKLPGRPTRTFSFSKYGGREAALAALKNYLQTLGQED